MIKSWQLALDLLIVTLELSELLQMASCNSIELSLELVERIASYRALPLA